jgi:hypothetical protein
MKKIEENTLYVLSDGSVCFCRKVTDKEVCFYKVSGWSGNALSLKKFSEKVVQEIGPMPA